MKLIVRAADYGMTDSITDGCIRAIKDGILTDVGLMTNNPCSKRAIEEILNYPHVSIGQDINLVSGMPCTPAHLVPSLVNAQGKFYTSRERIQRQDMGSINEDEMRLEIENQILRFIELVGKKPAYFMGHSYTSKTYEKIMAEMELKYQVIDLAKETSLHGFDNRWYPDLKGQKEGYTYQMQATTDVEQYIVEDKGNLLKHDFAILGTHCGYCDKELMEMSTFHIIRTIELSALCSEKVKQWIKKNEIELINVDQYLLERNHN